MLQKHSAIGQVLPVNDEQALGRVSLGAGVSRVLVNNYTLPTVK
jgi:hypothetical protein